MTQKKETVRKDIKSMSKELAFNIAVISALHFWFLFKSHRSRKQNQTNEGFFDPQFPNSGGAFNIHEIPDSPLDNQNDQELLREYSAAKTKRADREVLHSIDKALHPTLTQRFVRSVADGLIHGATGKIAGRYTGRLLDNLERAYRDYDRGGHSPYPGFIYVSEVSPVASPQRSPQRSMDMLD